MSPSDADTITSEAPLQMDSIESLRLQWSSFCARLQSHVSIETIRPLPEFLGLQNSSANNVQFSPNAFTTTPITSSGDRRVISERIQNRIRQNGIYFLSNYALVAAMTALVILLLHPSVIFMFAFLSALWWCHGYLIRHEVVVASIRLHSIFPLQQRFYLLFLLSCLLILITCIIPTILFLLISGFIILCHATLRDTSHLPSEQYDTDSESQLQDRKENSPEEERDPLLESP
jgi:PRA1 family protein